MSKKIITYRCITLYNDYLHYTNTDNPFGDGNLLSTFVWQKKLEKEGLIGEELERRTHQKQEETKRELEKVKKRRQEKELERQQRDEEMAMEQRQKKQYNLKCGVNKKINYRPRYFNRVHTGFEWNKYNQTHYDMDNSPPKIVQGYKFNIFYPDLIEKNATPQYFLTPCADNKDFALLRFHAGPPYEDIAFKIVNHEWEYSYKRGFR